MLRESRWGCGRRIDRGGTGMGRGHSSYRRTHRQWANRTSQQGGRFLRSPVRQCEAPKEVDCRRQTRSTGESGSP
jgi:hypothetical protein